MKNLPRGYRKLALTALIVCALTVFGGCIPVSYTVVSEPPGATVYLDNRPVGQTPTKATVVDPLAKSTWRAVMPGYEVDTVIFGYGPKLTFRMKQAESAPSLGPSQSVTPFGERDR